MNLEAEKHLVYWVLQHYMYQSYIGLIETNLWGLNSILFIHYIIHPYHGTLADNNT